MVFWWLEMHIPNWNYPERLPHCNNSTIWSYILNLSFKIYTLNDTAWSVLWNVLSGALQRPIHDWQCSIAHSSIHVCFYYFHQFWWDELELWKHQELLLNITFKTITRKYTFGRKIIRIERWLFCSALYFFFLFVLTTVLYLPCYNELHLHYKDLSNYHCAAPCWQIHCSVFCIRQMETIPAGRWQWGRSCKAGELQQRTVPTLLFVHNSKSILLKKAFHQ